MSDVIPNDRGSQPAFPTMDAGPNGPQLREWGLTRRELFAAMAMQGMVDRLMDDGHGSQYIAELAVERADALLAALDVSKEISK